MKTQVHVKRLVIKIIVIVCDLSSILIIPVGGFGNKLLLLLLLLLL
jgi:hypothetical protein